MNYDESYFNNKQTSNYQDYNLQSVYPAFFEYAKTLKQISNCQRVLDIGCAKGYFVLAFHNLKIDSYGIDISQYAIDHGDPQVKNKLSILNSEKEPLPFPDNYFDLIVSSEVVEHISDHHLLFSEIKRVLTPHGLVFITTPTHDPLNDKGEPIDKSHVSIFSRSQWLDIFKQYSLVPVDYPTYFKMVVGVVQGMSQTPAGSNLGKKLEKMGRLGKWARKFVLLFDLITHHQTDMFLLKKLS